MAANYIFKGVDLRTATVYDIADVLKDYPAIFVSPDRELSDEQERILSLYTFAEEYALTDLKEKLEDLYKEDLIPLS
ncbi:hypothetical protein EGI16_21420 [Chryseobacterium sp. G0240]|uniref:hypothetical protein n=1 Tax=Chryseobacterium sp. G0240 TaxID=2487066 RepID=UPI000F4520AE|nr:hypothetical protein [Chryseobacterium sp. G0240]ROH98398.1 hypothetical protein EGI16_21420 [Chryseobacterium sp. G0240]